MANLTINTTQNIKIEFKKASLGERILAIILDTVFILMYVILIFSVFTSNRLLNTSDQWSERAIMILFFLPVIFYSFWMESLFQGASLGKKIMRLKVIKIDGYQANYVDYFTRWAMRIVDITSCMGVIAIITSAFSDKGQRVGDIVAGTAVISTKERVHISATIFQEVASDYTPLFPQVMVLTDRDIQIIKEALLNARRNRDYKLLIQLSSKIESVLKVSRAELSEAMFVDSVIRDYNYLTARV